MVKYKYWLDQDQLVRLRQAFDEPILYIPNKRNIEQAILALENEYPVDQEIQALRNIAVQNNS